eukprot:5250117-Prymnesium_polylepis.2
MRNGTEHAEYTISTRMSKSHRSFHGSVGKTTFFDPSTRMSASVALRGVLRGEYATLGRRRRRRFAMSATASRKCKRHT